MADAFNTPGAVEPFGVFSSAAWQPQGRVLQISGHVAQDPDGNTVGIGDIQAQTRQVLENIRRVLVSGGGKMSDIAQVTAFVTDMSTRPELHQVRSGFFEPPHPARSPDQLRWA